MRLLRSLALLGAATTAACSSTEESAPPRPSTGTGKVNYSSLLVKGRFSEEAWRLDMSRMAQKPTSDVRVRVDQGLLLVQDQNEMLHAIDTATGMPRWVVQAPGELTRTPYLGADGIVLVDEDRIIGIDHRTGSRMATPQAVTLDFWPSSNGIDANGSLFFGRAAPFGVQAVDAQNGLGGWFYGTSSPVHELRSFGEGVLATVLGTTEDGLVFCLSPSRASGQRPRTEKWTVRLPASRIEGSMALDAKNAYLGGTDGFLYCIDAGNGVVRWKTACDAPHGHDSRPVVAGGDVYVRCGTALHAVNAENGSIRWTDESAGRLITRIGDLCYLEDGKTCRLVTAADGAQVAKFSLAPFAHVPSIQGGGMFLGATGRGQIVCYR